MRTQTTSVCLSVCLFVCLLITKCTVQPSQASVVPMVGSDPSVGDIVYVYVVLALVLSLCFFLRRVRLTVTNLACLAKNGLASTGLVL